MNDSVEENTDWIGAWILNEQDETNYWTAVDVARQARAEGDYEILREHLEALLRSGANETITATARQMSDADYDNTDWAEVATVLLSQ